MLCVSHDHRDGKKKRHANLREAKKRRWPEGGDAERSLVLSVEENQIFHVGRDAAAF